MYFRRFEELISTMYVKPVFGFGHSNILDITGKYMDILRVLDDLYGCNMPMLQPRTFSAAETII
jgi:hypothetical protein